MYDVFISYTTENERQAEKIRKMLESSGITCWFAPGTIHGSQDFTRVIPPAIRDSRTFLLVMSEAAQRSKWVKRELGIADKNDLPIYTLFLEDCPLDDDFDFVLQFNQHYKAALGFPEQMRRLIAELKEDLADPNKAVRPSQTARESVGSKKKSRLPLILGGAAAVIVVIVAVVLLLGGGLRDGEYVIWNPACGVALSGDPINTYYHAGEPVGSRGDTLTEYGPKCVWELDFEGESFTISRDGKTLGVEPGKRGIGLGGDFTADRWELVEADDGLYYIRNAESGFYLEWYEDKNNWATHDDVNENNRELFLVRIDPDK